MGKGDLCFSSVSSNPLSLLGTKLSILRHPHQFQSFCLS